MKMIDLGQEYPSMGTEVEIEVEKKTRKDYPCIYIRGDQVPEDLPKGTFKCMVEMRVAGMRNPTDGEKSVDLEVLRMSKPMGEMMDDDEEEEDDEGSDSFSEGRTIAAFRNSMEDVVKGESIGQSG